MKTANLVMSALAVAVAVLAALLLWVVFDRSEALAPHDARALRALDGHFTFLIAADLGRNGYYDQKPVAAMMGQVAELTDPEFVVVLGDAHHYDGVQSVRDPLWLTNFEWIYTHPELLIPWYPVLGNHEYRGSTRAVLDYSAVSRRWTMPNRYYSLSEEVSDTAEALLVFIDTTPLIDTYRRDPADYPDVAQQPLEEQLAWIDATLGGSDAAWKIVMGHHPVHAGTDKPTSERADLQQRLQPLLDAHGVDVAASGHIHNFQHLRVPGSDVDYVVTTSASKTRVVVPHEGALFASPDPGFALCTITDAELLITFVNDRGRIIYRHTRHGG